MKRLQQGKEGKKPKKTEPLAESIIPLNARGHRDWKSMSDGELVAYAQKFMEKEGITGRREFWRLDYGLYETLKRRGLLDKIEFEDKQRNWRSMSDEELVKHASEVLDEKGLVRRNDLKRIDSGLHNALRERGLLDRIDLENSNSGHRDWKSMSDEEIVDYARRFMRENGIIARNGLKKHDGGLYEALRVRGLLGRVFAPLESQNKREAIKQVVDAMEEFS